MPDLLQEKAAYNYSRSRVSRFGHLIVGAAAANWRMSDSINTCKSITRSVDVFTIGVIDINGIESFRSYANHCLQKFNGVVAEDFSFASFAPERM